LEWDLFEDENGEKHLSKKQKEEAERLTKLVNNSNCG